MSEYSVGDSGNELPDDKMSPITGDLGTISLKGKESYLSTKNRRRSKKDKVGRNFLCGCGKEYLSYPALYTHIKTKHEGIHPEGTKAHSASTSKRGRPKKIDYKDSENNKTLNVNTDNSNPLTIGANLKPGQIIDNKTLLTDYVSPKDLRIVEKLNLLGTSNPTDGFSCIKFHNDDKPTFHPFHIIINKLLNETQLENIKGNSCDHVFSMFLFSVSKFVTTKFYLVLGIFFRNLRECLNQYGYEVIEKYLRERYGDEAKDMLYSKTSLVNNPLIYPNDSNKGTNKNIQGHQIRVFCVDEPAEYVPLIAEKFILYYLPRNCPHFDQQLALDLIYDFCNWLIKRKLTKIKISFANGSNSPNIKPLSKQEELENN